MSNQSTPRSLRDLLTPEQLEELDRVRTIFQNWDALTSDTGRADSTTDRAPETLNQA